MGSVFRVLWVLAGTSVAGNRCPTQLFYATMKPSETTVSPELQEFMNLHKIETLSQLLRYENAELLKMEGFGWRLMKQVLKIREVHSVNDFLTDCCFGALLNIVVFLFYAVDGNFIGGACLKIVRDKSKNICLVFVSYT